MKLPDVDRDGQVDSATPPSTAAQWRMHYDDTAATPDNADAARLRCPDCGELLMRVPRRLVDRLTSLFSPVQRYLCRSPRCQWRGNMPAQLPGGNKPENDLRG